MLSLYIIMCTVYEFIRNNREMMHVDYINFKYQGRVQSGKKKS